MKFVVAFAAVLAVASAQFGFPTSQPPRYQPTRYPLPSPTPFPTRLPLPSPTPFVPAPIRPSVAPVAIRGSDQDASIVRYDNDIGPDGSFSYAFQTDNGIAAEAQGTPRDFGGNPPVVPVVIQGAYSYTSPEGQPISITYIANENGFQPQGDSIPTPPPIPEPILRSLEFLARNAPAAQKK